MDLHDPYKLELCKNGCSVWLQSILNGSAVVFWLQSFFGTPSGSDDLYELVFCYSLEWLNHFKLPGFLVYMHVKM